ncbi:MAG TPA: FmdB family zinc ribbon protein [Terriglobales bacterium]|nr:FmdB family zinc ribbon protein [Terriglobales bacterium]
MPIYEYQCRRCGRRVEKIQSFRDAALTTCEACGGALERLVSPPAIQFKGSGWYITDYAHKSTAAPAKNGEGGGAQPAAGQAGEKTGSETPGTSESGAKKDS